MRFLLLSLVLAASASAQSSNSTTQNVTVVVEEVNEISVSDDVTLTVNTATTAGGDFDPVENTASTYAVTSNGSNKKITGQLVADFTTGITLEVDLVAPSSGSSEGKQTLTSASAVDLVTGVAQVSDSGLGITYTATVDGDVAPNGTGETQVVTFTILTDS